MNRNEFFAVAKLTNAPIIVRQVGDQGYSLSLINNQDETLFEENQTTEITLMYKNDPRLFKSISGIESTLKEQGIYSFSVKMSSETIEKKTRVVKTDEERQLELIEKAEQAVKIAEQKAKEAKEKAQQLKNKK